MEKKKIITFLVILLVIGIMVAAVISTIIDIRESMQKMNLDNYQRLVDSGLLSF